jgi:hypothetical protein
LTAALPTSRSVEAFGRLAAESPALAPRCVEAHPAVARLMPGRRMLSDADRPATERMTAPTSSTPYTRGSGRARPTAPVLVLLEDVHWADQSTRELLSFCSPADCPSRSRSSRPTRRRPPPAPPARRPPRSGPGCAASQPHPAHPLDDARHPRAGPPLHPGPLREIDVRRIVQRAEGNAFFTEELVAASELGGATLPTDLADLLLLRLDQLDDATRLAVRAASVAGRRVSHDVLSRVVGVDGASLERVLRSAVDNNV